MKILILDDDQIRLDSLTKRYKHGTDNVVAVKKYGECVSHLRERQWDLISLDHDLGDQNSDADCYDNGWEDRVPYNGWHVVQEILACDFPEENLPKRVIVHSVNPVGANRMFDALRRRGIDVSWEPYSE